MKDAIVAHRIQIPESALTDLAQRLAHTRWPDRETPEDWSQGIPLAYMQEVVRYWASEYDWRRCEDRINRFNPFKTKLDGLDIHFLHVRSPREDALPLVYWNELDKGGHFAAFEQPAAFVEELRNCFRQMR